MSQILRRTSLANIILDTELMEQGNPEDVQQKEFIRHTRAQASRKNIEISIRRQDLYTGLMISDQGMGIPETEYNKIFQRFYRGKQVQNEEGPGEYFFHIFVKLWQQ